MAMVAVVAQAAERLVSVERASVFEVVEAASLNAAIVSMEEKVLAESAMARVTMERTSGEKVRIRQALLQWSQRHLYPSQQSS